MRNRRIWDYLCGVPQWSVKLRFNDTMLTPKTYKPSKQADLRKFNLQLVAGLKNKRDLCWVGFVTSGKHDSCEIVTQAENLTCDEVILIDQRLFSLPSTLILPHTRQDDYLVSLMRNKVRHGTTQQKYLLPELI